MKGFSFKKILEFIKEKKAIFITIGIVIVVAIGLIIASSIMGSSSVKLKSEAFQLDEKTSIEAGTVSGGGTHLGDNYYGECRHSIRGVRTVTEQ